MGNHTPGFNHESLSIVLIGGLDDANSLDPGAYTLEQWDTLGYLLALAFKEWPEARAVQRMELQRRKGDPPVMPFPPHIVADTIEKARTQWPLAKPITEVVKVKPPRPRLPKEVPSGQLEA